MNKEEYRNLINSEIDNGFKGLRSLKIPQHHREMTERRMRGEFLHEIGLDYNISREMVRQIEAMTLRKLHHIRTMHLETFPDNYDLSVRSNNCLKHAGFTEEQVREFIKTKEGRAELLRIPNFGRKSLNELIEVLGEKND